MAAINATMKVEEYRGDVTYQTLVGLLPRGLDSDNDDGGGSVNDEVELGAEDGEEGVVNIEEEEGYAPL